MTPDEANAVMFLAVLGCMAGFWGMVYGLLRRNTLTGGVAVFWLSFLLLVFCLLFVLGIVTV